MHFLKCINFAEQVYIDKKKKKNRDKFKGE